jgi:hypothetical protein
MEQKVAKVNNEDIKRIIERDFPVNETDKVINILSKYKSETEKGRNRVHAAILKIANCNAEKIEKYVEVAIVDSRDVLSMAEYPNYTKFYRNGISDKEKSQLFNDDWKQYNEWLNKV